jgi:hypothetical protein
VYWVRAVGATDPLDPVIPLLCPQGSARATRAAYLALPAPRAPPASQYAGRRRRRRHCAVDTAVFLGSSAVLGRSQEELRGDRIPL